MAFKYCERPTTTAIAKIVATAARAARF